MPMTMIERECLVASGSRDLVLVQRLTREAQREERRQDHEEGRNGRG